MRRLVPRRGVAVTALVFMFMQAHATAQEAAPGRAHAPPSPRQELLHKYVDGYVRSQNFLEYVGYGSVGLGSGGLALGIAKYEDERKSSLASIGGNGLGTAAFLASLAASRDVRAEVLRIHLHHTAMVWALSVAVAEESRIPRVTAAALASAYLFAGVLESINGFSHTPTSTLRIDGELLRAEGNIPDAELAPIEKHLLGTESVVPHAVGALPYCLAAPVAAIPLLDDSATAPERTWAAILGGLTAILCRFRVNGTDVAHRYKDHLGRAGLQLLASPKEVGVHYTF